MSKETCQQTDNLFNFSSQSAAGRSYTLILQGETSELSLSLSPPFLLPLRRKKEAFGHIAITIGAPCSYYLQIYCRHEKENERDAPTRRKESASYLTYLLIYT